MSLPLLIVRLSNLNVITLSKCLDHQNKIAPTIYTFALSLLFLFLLFKSKHLIITMASPSSCHDLHFLHHLECATYLMITYINQVSTQGFINSLKLNQSFQLSHTLLICLSSSYLIDHSWTQSSLHLICFTRDLIHKSS